MSKKTKIAIITGTLLALQTISVSAHGLYTDETSIKNDITSHIRLRETPFVEQYAGDKTSFATNFNTIVKNACTADDYLALSWTNVSPSVKLVNNVFEVTFNVDYLSTKAQEDYSDSELQKVVQQIITPNMTDFQKVQAINKYISDRYSYDDSLTSRSVYQALTTSKAVCQNYAMTAYRMFQYAGMQNRIVEGSIPEGRHAWNMVVVDGNWYNLDVTNNDYSGRLKYFLVSDTYLTDNGFVWDKSIYPKALTTYTLPTIDVTTVTTAVVKAEGAKLQADVDSARVLVNALPTGTDKTNLTSRLDVVQNLINSTNSASQAIATAINAVVKAEGAKIQADVDSARVLVNALPTGTDKTNLTNRLNVVQNLINSTNSANQAITTATNAVAKAEGARVQADVNSARTLVNALPTGTDKIALTSRLDVVQKAIDGAKALVQTATNAVVKAEGSKLQADVDSAKALVNALPDGTAKTSLTNRLNAVQSAIDNVKALTQAITNATNAVVKAEGSKLQADVDSAKALVNALPSGTAKTSLLNRLNTVQSYINSTTTTVNDKKLIDSVTAMVVNAEKYKTDYYINRAKTGIATLKDSAEKTSLSNRISNVEKTLTDDNIILATNAVYYAEKYKTQNFISISENAVSVLPDGDTKTTLLNRLNAVKNQIGDTIGTNSQALIDKAKKDMLNAERYANDYYIGIIEKDIASLSDCKDKTDFISRLNTVYDRVDKVKINVVNGYLDMAVKYKKKVYLNMAIKYLGEVKNTATKAEIQKRIDTVSKLTLK